MPIPTHEMTLRRADGESCSFLFRRCDAADLAEIAAVQETVARGIENVEIFVSTTEDELRESLDLDFCVGAYCAGELAAFTLMVANRVSYRNLGSYTGLDEAELLKCVTYDTTFVLPEYRGYGLQRLFNAFKDEYALSLGAERAMATVSPDNPYSLNNALAHGFTVLDERPMYGGVLRCLLEKRFAR